MKKSAKDYCEAGNANYRNSNFEAAIADYDKAIELNPKYAKAYNNRGCSKDDLKQYEAAIADLDKAIELDPESANAYYNRGSSKHALKQYKASIADYDKAIELDPENALFYNNRGISKAALKQYEASIADYDTTIKLKPEYAAAYNNRGNSKAALKQDEASIADFDKAIELDPKNTSYYYNRGSSKAALKQYEDAISDYDKAIELNPESANAYYNRGNLYQKSNQTDKAIADFLKLIPMTREDPPVSLYKYMPINGHQLLSLINGEVYFAPYSQLNDPLECFFLNKDSGMGECFRQHNIEPRICSMVKQSPDMEASGSTLMFAHYANEHKGICVEYEIDIEKLKKNQRVAYGEVLYEKKTEVSDLKDLYMLKDTAWEYEEEFRFVRFDNNEFAPAKIKSITFGLKCTPAHRKIIRHLLPKDIDYYEMKHEDEGNQITKKQVTWPDEPICKEDVFKLMLKEELTHL